jgi:hypothetical protein
VAVAALLLLPAPTWAQTAPNLGAAAPYGSASDTFTNTAGGTVINGDLCYTIAPAVNPAVTGTTTVPCPPAVGADQTAALADVNGQVCTALPAGNLDAVVIGANPPGTIPPGCYERAGAIDITANGIVNLNGNGIFIFRSSGGAVTTGANSQVLVGGGASAGCVFWAPVGATTLGANSSFVGTILAAAGVTLDQNASLVGRALAVGGTVTSPLGGNVITVPGGCAAAVPTFSQWATVALALLLALAGFAAMRLRHA